MQVAQKNMKHKTGRLYGCGLVALCFGFWLAVTPVVMSQTIIRNFPGVNSTNVYVGTPPDTMGAIGTNQFAQLINGAFAVYSRDGQRQLLLTDSNFWTRGGIDPAPLTSGLTDTRLIFDPLSARWFATELTLADYTYSNLLMLARSDTADPAGTWKALVVATNNGDSGSPTGFFDFDTLGVDSNGVYISVNNLTPDRNGNTVSDSLYSIPKADLIAATPSLARMSKFTSLNPTDYGYTMQLDSSTTGGPTEKLVSIDSTGYNFIDVTTLSNTAAAGAALSTAVHVPVQYDGFPNNIVQPGGSAVPIDPATHWFQSASKLVGTNLFLVRHIGWNGHDAIDWIVLDVLSNSVVAEGVISDSNYDFSYPSIAVNQRGDIVTVFCRSGSNSPAGNMSLYGAVGKIANRTVTMGAPFLIQQGTTSGFYIDYDTPPYRWGDYSATQVDPTDDQLFWTVNEIALETNIWHTQITLLSLNTNRPALTLSRTGTNVLVSWPLSADPAYGLEMKTNLTAAGVWLAVTNHAVAVRNQNQVTLPESKKSLYFRLKK